MSHLTSSPPQYSRPPPSRAHFAQRSLHPPSPPETEVDSMADPSTGAGLYEQQQHGAHHHLPQAAPIDTPTERFRRVSALAYNAKKESRNAPRPTRWLVVVIPPATLSSDPMLLPSLSSGPTGRFSNGTLMPLYPTLFAQLQAIGKEFGLPAANGISVYLHFDDGPHAMSPRVSDESWPYLWGSYFNPDSHHQHHTHQLPIAGRVEFDIDTRKATWLNSWLTHSRRVSVDTSLSMAQGRGGSQASVVHDGSPEDDYASLDDPQQALRLQRSEVRQPFQPRTLSLLQRRDASRTSSSGRRRGEDDADHPPLSRLAIATHSASKLSPIAPTPELQNAAGVPREKKELVMKWRETSAKTPTTEAIRAVNDPTSLPASEHDDLVELDLNDFAWSISSAGPPSHFSDELAYSDRSPSVHLLSRLEGSVILTPSVATSFGPQDDWPISPDSNASRYPSPDLGQRMMDDVPVTPSVATSFGPLYDDELGSPVSFVSYYPSPDIAGRMMDDVPVTPSTATSWGAPSILPDSPVEVEYVHRPGAWELESPIQASFAQRHEASPSQFVWPYYTPFTAQPSRHVWPYYDSFTSIPSRHVWPYYNSFSSAPSRHVWPYLRTSTAEAAPAPSLSVTLRPSYPSFSLYPPVYPNLEIYPPVPSIPRTNGSLSTALQSHYPNLVIYAPVYPHLDIYPAVGKPLTPAEADAKRRKPGYPYIEIYPAAYPYFDLYPTTSIPRAQVPAPSSSSSTPPSTRLPARYPNIEVYSACYPYFSLYPAIVVEDQVAKEVSVALKPVYPILTIYPAAYPYFDIYPTVKVDKRSVTEKTPEKPIAIRLSPGYPVITLYPPVYPAFELYPAIPSKSVQSLVSDRSNYPYFEIYPACYPHFSLYPPAAASPSTINMPMSTSLGSRYPYLEIYPSVYPYLSLYPSASIAKQSVKSSPVSLPAPVTRSRSRTVSRTVRLPSRPNTAMTKSIPPVPSRRSQALPPLPPLPVVQSKVFPPVPPAPRTSVVSLARAYPYLDIYPACYPHFSLYPRKDLPGLQVPGPRSLNIKLEPGYPTISLYPAVYPNLEIYPPVVPIIRVNSTRGKPVMLEPGYPNIILYKPVYPHIVIYPEVVRAERKEVTSVVRYPYFEIYPARYPHITLYPSPAGGRYNRQVTTGKEQQYPYFEIYPAQYPYISLYPSPAGGKLATGRDEVSEKQQRRGQKTHADLHIEVFGRLPTRLRKTHAELHAAVFNSGIDTTLDDSPKKRYPSSPPPIPRRSPQKTTTRPPPPPVPPRHLPPVPESALGRSTSLVNTRVAHRPPIHSTPSIDASTRSSRRTSVSFQLAHAMFDADKATLSQFPAPPGSRLPVAKLERKRFPYA